MIKLATVFSGIGAIEHALQRMGIKHQIVFACDNGDVDILTKDIPMNIDDIGNELIALRESIKVIQFSDEVEQLYKNQLDNMLKEAVAEYEAVLKSLDKFDLKDESTIKSILNNILSREDIKETSRKEYKKVSAQLGVGSNNQKVFCQLLCLISFEKDCDNLDILTDEELSFLSHAKESIETLNGKKLVRAVRDLSQRTSQLHEKINYLKVQRELELLCNDWKARKEYVDTLYKGLESKNKVKKSYTSNYKVNDDDFHWNVAFLSGKQYENEVDLFVGGSPCQSFSLVGKQRGLEDTRGTLFYEFARLIGEIKPKVFIYENVRAVTSHNSGMTWNKMQEVFSELGYNFSWEVLNAKNYGIPQNRERLFVVGFRNDLILEKKFEFPKPIPLQTKMKDFLLDNANGSYFLPNKGVAFVTSEKNLSKRFTQIDGEVGLCQKKNQQYNWHGDFVFQSEDEAKAHNIPNLEKYFLSEKVRKYVLSTGTKSFYSKPKTDLDIARPILTTMHKMHRAGVDNYVTTDGRLRKLTPRECLRLMGFSDDFNIVVSDTSMYQQAGNSIVVDVLIHIMNNILESYPNLLS